MGSPAPIAQSALVMQLAERQIRVGPRFVQCGLVELSNTDRMAPRARLRRSLDSTQLTNRAKRPAFASSSSGSVCIEFRHPTGCVGQWASRFPVMRAAVVAPIGAVVGPRAVPVLQLERAGKFLGDNTEPPSPLGDLGIAFQRLFALLFPPSAGYSRDGRGSRSAS